MENTIFDIVGDKVYSNDIVNVTFDKSSKTVAKDKNGNVKYKPQIKVSKKGKSGTSNISLHLITAISLISLSIRLSAAFNPAISTFSNILS